jgi:sulfide:quinone oxidoreductase
MLQVGSMSIRQHCDGTQPSRLAWLLKERMLPPLYWDGMLKGREWLAQPDMARSPAQ